MSAGPGAAGGRAYPRTTLVVVFATILIDFIGFSVLIPVLPLYAERLGATSVQVGLILSLYALAQLLFLPVWGWVSDRVGRRPVLLVSLAGTAVSFVLLALAESVAAIYAARILSGLFAASIGTAQAVVTDVTPPEERAGGMGVLGAAFGAGMIVGPVLGGGLAALHERLPFYAVAFLSAASFGLAWARLPESRPRDLARPSARELAKSFVPAPIRLALAVHDRRIALYLWLFFQLFTAFAVLEGMITLYMGERYGADELDAALLFGWIGVVLALVHGLAAGRLAQRTGEPALVGAGLVLMAVGIGGVAVAPSVAWLYALGAVIAIGNGLALPAFASLFSQACRAEAAGELLGQGQSMATAGRIVGPVAAGALMRHVSLGAPFLAAALLLGLALLVFVGARRVLLGERGPGAREAGPASP